MWFIDCSSICHHSLIPRSLLDFISRLNSCMGKVANVTIHDLHSVTWCVASLMAHLITSVSVCKQIKLPSLKLATYKLSKFTVVCISPSSLSSSASDYRTIAEILETRGVHRGGWKLYTPTPNQLSHSLTECAECGQNDDFCYLYR